MGLDVVLYVRHRPAYLARYLVANLRELPPDRGELSGNFGKAFWAEDDERDHQDHQHLGWVEVEHRGSVPTGVR